MSTHFAKPENALKRAEGIAILGSGAVLKEKNVVRVFLGGHIGYVVY
tara:strand:- start:442 stop:582 length:141 start_codon:yes stop_codon:yes gene_type:complete